MRPANPLIIALATLRKPACRRTNARSNVDVLGKDPMLRTGVLFCGCIIDYYFFTLVTVELTIILFKDQSKIENKQCSCSESSGELIQIIGEMIVFDSQPFYVVENKELLRNNNIEVGRVHLVLRDSGANIKKATKDMGVNNESCFIHTQQLVVVNSLEEQTSLMEIVSIAKK
ncbi:unnamed protein product [Acanthoscelides obtectus]|uniref:Uncharacterized protein n=1 Tax=Acanthoscelides obtectus TaxID=200917 RepID=A0A9P0LED7_ACAOB|nr:unnamed protein product [Acanthoscelides obtectus]CAK1621583.1 hypothetical protein AOBTE_LOCUS1028 [Acanthoscelides obtectus]